MDTSDYGLSNPFKGPGVVANGLIGIKVPLGSVSLFSIGDGYTAVEVPIKIKVLKDRLRANVGAVLQKMNVCGQMLI
jgi:hypothetical protein